MFLNLMKWFQIKPPKPHCYNTTCLQSKFFPLGKHCLYLIKIGFYYAKKVDNNYYANLIVKICKKHLNIKDITVKEVLKDLYLSSKFGPYFKYRNIKGFLGRSILFSMINRLFWASGLLIYLNRSHNINVDLSRYQMRINWLLNLDLHFSALNLVEIVFLIGIILRIFLLLYIWRTLSDRRLSIYNLNSNLLLKLNSNQKLYFYIGVVMFGLLSRLGILTRILFYYLIVSNLNIIPSFFKIPVIFVFVEYILNQFLNICGFEYYYPLDILKKKMQIFYNRIYSILIEFKDFILTSNFIRSIMDFFTK